MYIHQLPYFESMECCYILDEHDLWEKLGIFHMKFGRSDIQFIKREARRSGKSPTEILFSLWGDLNHTVLELFILLSDMKNYPVMEILKKFVSPKNHILIKNSKMLTVSNTSSVGKSVGLLPKILYEDLKKSTNNWNDSTILGKGGFGIVYKGIWKCTEVAIKRIKQKKDNPKSYDQEMKQSITELHWLNSYRHDNILPVYGYSIGGPEPCLVYQYMPGGSLEQRLRVEYPLEVLTWPARKSIAIGSARGLQFLHTIGDKPLVHGDIKTANILLDRYNVPRIGDFGLAREGPLNNYTKVTTIQGTLPYLPDEFLRSHQFSVKVDTYSFGIVLFEIATALAVFSKKRKKNFLKDHIVDYEGDIMSLKDRSAEGGDSCFMGLLNVGKFCVSHLAKNRPEMVQVLKKLESIFEDSMENYPSMLIDLQGSE